MDELSGRKPEYLEGYDTVIGAVDRLEELEDEELDPSLQDEYRFLRIEIGEILKGLALDDPFNTTASEVNERLKMADELFDGNYEEVKTYLQENYDI